jgi:hypothetical protein
VVSAEILVQAISELVHTGQTTVTTTSLRVTPGFALPCDYFQLFRFYLCVSLISDPLLSFRPGFRVKPGVKIKPGVSVKQNQELL